MGKKITSWLIIWCLVMQTAAPAAAAGSAVKGRTRTVSIPTALFDASMPSETRELLRGYLEYLVDATSIRRQMRPLNKQLNQALTEDRDWRALEITDSTFADLQKEAGQAANFLSDKSIPIEDRLFGELNQLEARFLAMLEQAESRQAAPDGLMEVARQLETMQSWEGEIYSLKFNYLARLTALRANILNNYLAGKAPDPKTRLNALRSQQKTMLSLGAELTGLENQYLDVVAGFKGREKSYNAGVSSRIRPQAIQLEALRTEVQRQIVLLRGDGSSNQLHHADLLAEIELVLDGRLAKVREKIASLESGRSTGNFLYLPDEWSAAPRFKDLTTEFRRIGVELVSRTRDRDALAGRLLEILDRTSSDLDALSGAFRKLSNQSNLDQARVDEINRAAEQEIDSARQEISSLRKQLAEARALLPPAGLAANEVLNNRDHSNGIIRFNLTLEKLSPALMRVEGGMWAVNVELAHSLTELLGDRAEQARGWQELERQAQGLDIALGELSGLSRQIHESRQADGPLFTRLQKFLQSLLPRAADAFAEKTRMVEEVLNAYVPPPSPTMRQVEHQRFVKGLLEMLRQRSRVTAQLATLSPINDAGRITANHWQQAATSLGSAPMEGIGQLEGLADLDSTLIRDLLQGELDPDWTVRLFGLSRALMFTPYLHLKDDSIDAYFRLGNGQVRVPNIGAPSKLYLGATWNDPLLSPSYIGGWFSPKAAWESAKEGWGKLKEKTVAFGRDTWNGVEALASDVVKTAKVVGNKITAVAKPIVDTALYVGTKFGENFLDEDGSVAWLKIASYGFDAGTCLLGALNSCVSFAIHLTADVARTGLDIAEEKGMISPESKESWGTVITCGEFVAEFFLTTPKGASLDTRMASYLEFDNITNVLGPKPGGSPLNHLVRMINNKSSWKNIMKSKSFLDTLKGAGSIVNLTRYAFGVSNNEKTDNIKSQATHPVSNYSPDYLEWLKQGQQGMQNMFNILLMTNGSLAPTFTSVPNGSSGVWLPGMEPAMADTPGFSPPEKNRKVVIPPTPKIKVVPLPW